MNKAEFDVLFDRMMLTTLAPHGFTLLGKTVAARDATNTIALIRLGGRMALPGSIAHILCFRHSFLRDLQERVPTRVSTEVFDYPFKHLPSALLNSSETSWSYRPINLNYRYDRFSYAELNRLRVAKWLQALACLIADRVVPWARSMTPERAATQLKEHGEKAWCETMWLRDYIRHARQATS